MDRRKRLLVNAYEVATDVALQKVAEKHGVRVLIKPRVADALDIEGICISREAYSYALKAHFDFVVVREDATPFCAVEVDGPQHLSDPQTRYRDHLKNMLCRKLGMPLVRMDADFLRQVGPYSVISWLLEMWLLYEDWQAAQLRGEVSEEEPFLFFAFPGYDPFAAARAFVHQQYELGKCLAPVPEELSVLEGENSMLVLALISLTEERTIIGKARCLCFQFPTIPSVSPRILAQELSVVDAVEKLKSYVTGRYEPATAREVQAWRERQASWKEVTQFLSAELEM